MSFEQAAYVTCREAQAKPSDVRRAVAIFLVEHASRKRGVVIPEGEPGSQLGYLVRGGCTLAPDAYLFTVIDRAVQAEAGKLPKRQRGEELRPALDRPRSASHNTSAS